MDRYSTQKIRNAYYNLNEAMIIESGSLQCDLSLMKEFETAIKAVTPLFNRVGPEPLVGGVSHFERETERREYAEEHGRDFVTGLRE